MVYWGNWGGIYTLPMLFLQTDIVSLFVIAGLHTKYRNEGVCCLSARKADPLKDIDEQHCVYSLNFGNVNIFQS